MNCVFFFFLHCRASTRHCRSEDELGEEGIARRSNGGVPLGGL